MTTATLTRRTATAHVCQNCNQPANDEQGLVLEVGGYIHPACSAQTYELVTTVSIPSGQGLGVIAPAPMPVLVSAPMPVLVLCSDCQGLHDPFDLCPACQEAYNQWESDHAPDYDLLFERIRSAADYLLVVAV
jgi:hypothetical protein